MANFRGLTPESRREAGHTGTFPRVPARGRGHGTISAQASIGASSGNHFGSSLHRGILSRGPSVAVFNIKNHTVQEGICSICYCPTHGAVEKAILRTCVVLENVFFLEHVVGCRSAGRLGTARIHIHTMHTFDVLGCTRHCKEQHTYNAASERY